MKIRKIEPIQDKAEGTCMGFPYDTQLASSAGVSIHLWVKGNVDSPHLRQSLQKALSAAMRHRDIVSATWSFGEPTKFWCNNDINN